MFQKELHKKVQSSIIHNSLKLEITQMFINRKTETDIVVYSYIGILISNKKEQTTAMYNDMRKSQKSCVQAKEAKQKRMHIA